MALRASGRVAAQTDLTVGSAGGGITQAPPVNGNTAAGGIAGALGQVDANGWVWVIFGASVLYLVGAYIMLGRYRVPL
ncbi:MAG TPA: hypothetical protein VJ741_09650 [Solirubrobacteraceae bacterium]|nr:hypothetical protein [Solirubrobacteraceae bacterium]